MSKNVSINIQRNDGFKWYHSDNVFAKGYIFDEKDGLHQGTEIVDLFKNIRSVEEFIDKLKKANGSFSVIINRHDQLFAGVDRLRSIPIFYMDNDNGFSVCDAVEYREECNRSTKLCTESISELISLGCVCNNDTILSETKQLQAGQYLHFNAQRNELIVSFYFVHRHNVISDNYCASHLSDTIVAISENVIKRIIKTIKNRRVVIPLSGGYDSRYIACMFKKAGYNDVTCYTYGRTDSHEVKNARNTADKLDYKWHYIEYNASKWHEVLESPEFVAYCLYAFNYSSLPHIQDYIAIRELTINKLISPDSIIIPGYCGDLLGGSYIPNEVVENREKSLLKEGLDRYIFRRYTIFNKHKITKDTELKMIGAINEFTSLFTVSNTEEFVSVNEAWFTNHKVSKYIVNSLRVYEFLGYEWRMPLWDNELIDFWYSIPVKLRIKSSLYNETLQKAIYKPLRVDFQKDRPMVERGLLARARKIVPFVVARKIKGLYHIMPRWMKRYCLDINAFDEFAYYLQEDMGVKKPEKRKGSTAIELFASWFTEKYLMLKK